MLGSEEPILQGQLAARNGMPKHHWTVIRIKFAIADNGDDDACKLALPVDPIALHNVTLRMSPSGPN